MSERELKDDKKKKGPMKHRQVEMKTIRLQLTKKRQRKPMVEDVGDVEVATMLI